jgi:diguanylate cyclase (GGDEF)-like protein
LQGGGCGFDPHRLHFFIGELPRMLETDHVTGLAPRGELEKWFATRAGIPGAVAAVLADVVGLKEINRQGGFAAGDAALRTAALRFRAATEPAAILARLGGDELIAVFVGPDATSLALAAVERMRGDAGLPPLRAAAAAADDREPLGQLIDRLYATVRHS